MSEPRVSIIIPCYNASRWLSETLESALGQTWENKEIILVDDGSTDESLAIARSFGPRGVKVLTQANMNGCVARNHGYSVSTGEYLQFLDADDLLSPEKIEKQVLLLENMPPNLLAVCESVSFLDGEPITEALKVSKNLREDTDNPLEWMIRLMEGGMIPQHSWLIPRTTAEKAGPWNESLTIDQDGEYMCRVVLASNGIRTTPGVYSYYRRFRDRGRRRVSSSTSLRKFQDRVAAADSKAKQILGRTVESRAKLGLVRQYMRIALEAYPKYPSASELAEERAISLSSDKYIRAYTFTFPSKMSERLNRMFGWKVARRIQSNYHALFRR